MQKKVLSALIAIAMVVSISTPTLADPASDLRSKQAELQNNQSQLDKANQDSSSLEDKIQKLDNQIEGIDRQVKDTDKKIASTQQNIADAEKGLKRAEDDIRSEQDLYNRRMRAMYISGDNGYIGVIIQAKGVGDLISRVESVRKIAEYDNKIIQDLKGKKDVVEEKRQALAAENSKLIALQADNRNKLDNLNKDKSTQDALLAQLKAQQLALGNKIELTKNEINSMQQQIAAAAAAAAAEAAARVALANASTSTNSTSTNSANSASASKNSTSSNNSSAPITRGTNSLAGSADSIISYAGQFLGRPYVWGATGPDSFDCSGLVQYVYGHNGISLPRTTYEQVNCGITVTGDLQPGDLLFYGDPSSPHHVAIYIGGGQRIHAPQTGDVVRIAPIGDYSIAKRVR